MKSIYKFLLPLLVLTLVTSCDDWLDVNENPNQLVDVPSGDLLLKGTLLASAQIHKGHLMRTAAYYSGGLIGNQLVQQTIYIYNFTPGDAESNWEHLYNGVLVQNKKIRELSPNRDGLNGIIDVNEAMSVGTAASLWGDIPYSTAVPDNPNLESTAPSFDAQASIFAATQTLLDRGINTLNDAKTNPGDIDIFHGGDTDKWMEAAYTLKARHYMHVKDYDAALDQVDKGISSPDNDLNFIPIGTVDDNSNLIHTLASGSRAGDMTGEDAFLQQLLDPANADSRNNAKTDETARRNYLYISGDGSSDNGIDAPDEPMPLVTYAENTLIWAECLLRGGDTPGAIDKLNELREKLNEAATFNITDAADTYKYEPYVMADFEAGGMENADGISVDRAVLREIIEERYVSGFTTYIPFDDVRRLRKSDSDVIVPFPLNTTTATMNPQRMLYPGFEIEGNPNVPSPLPDLFTPTPVNQ